MPNAKRVKPRPGKSIVYPRRDMIFLLPGLLGFLLFYILPLMISLYHALVESAFIPRFVGIQNFLTILQNAYYQLALKNSLQFMLLLPLCLISAAMLLAPMMRKLPLIRPLQSVFLSPAFLPSAAIASIWALFFSSNSQLSLALRAAGGMFSGDLTIKWLCLFTLALWKNFGMILVLLLGAMFSLDTDLEQAAALDGASQLRQFIHIIFPQLKPALMFILIYAIMCSMRVYREAYLLFGPYPSESIYLIQHYMNNHFAKLNYQYLSSGAIILAAIISLVMLPLMRIMRHFSESI